ncbi:MAG: helix-hairpin-helix domain-containing protein [Bacteroidaceae bacterium]|nr:helix-hairpin-helix domain-containing protein [Bacteroidaceae bacterium]
MQHFSRSNQRGCIFAFVIAAAVVSGMMLDRWLFNDSSQLSSLNSLIGDSLQVTAPITVIDSDTTLQPVYPEQEETITELSDFDPNTADSATLVRLGFSPWQARSICRYRAKGGRFHRVDDMKRIYGMTPELYNRISPYTRIGEQFRYYEDLGESQTYTRRPQHDTTSHHSGIYGRRDTTDYPHSDKFTEPVILDLNLTDTATMKRIPGIGDVRAKRIAAYREALGGFVTPEQLNEIDGLPPGIEQWFTVEGDVFRHIKVNSDPIRTLARHPYITYAQARAIEQYRRTNGRITDLHELQLLDEFSEADFQRLAPYVEY